MSSGLTSPFAAKDVEEVEEEWVDIVEVDEEGVDVEEVVGWAPFTTSPSSSAKGDCEGWELGRRGSHSSALSGSSKKRWNFWWLREKGQVPSITL